MARSREVRKLDQKRATSSTDNDNDYPFGRLHAQLSESRTEPPIAKP